MRRRPGSDPATTVGSVALVSPNAREDLVVPGVGGQAAPFDVQVHRRVVEEVPQRNPGQCGAKVDLVVPRLGGGVHRDFDAGGGPLDQPCDGTCVIAHVCHDVAARPPWKEGGAVELCIRELVELTGEEHCAPPRLEQCVQERRVIRLVVAGDHQASLTTWFFSWPSPSMVVTRTWPSCG
jgi:hypothetical protein